MQEIINKLQENNIDTNNLKQINPKDLKIRKKIDILIDQDTTAINFTAKSRVLKADVEKFEKIHQTIIESQDDNPSKKVIIIDAPLCSKAKALFQENNWQVIN